MRLRDWLRENDLELHHPGHGHGEQSSPVMFSQVERLDAEWTVEPVEPHNTGVVPPWLTDDQAPPPPRHHRYTRGID